MLVAAAALLIAAPVAFAQQVAPTNDQYDTTLELVSSGERGGPPQAAPGEPTASADGVGGLPFTGLDIVALLAAAVALGGAGLVLRQLTRTGSATGGGRIS